MKLHELVAPARRRARRVGRGLSAGQGKTAGRGTKGQKARRGFNLPRRFEGGQSSLIQRLPKKRGFRSPYPKPATVRIDVVLTRIEGDKVSPKLLHEAGLITHAEFKAGSVKIIGTAEKLRALKGTKGILWSKALAERITKLAK